MPRPSRANIKRVPTKLVVDDLEGFAHRLEAEVDGVIAVAGPALAANLPDLGLIDEYLLYFTFAGACPPLRLIAIDHVGEDAVRRRFVIA